VSILKSLTRRLALVLNTHHPSAPKAKKFGALALLWLALFAVSIGGFRWYRVNHVPLSNQSTHLPDPVIVGGPDAAIKHTRKVIALLRDAKWNSFGVPFAELRLPDARYAETDALRDPLSTSYAVPNGVDGDPSNEPVYRDVACYTSIYARANPTYYSGERVRFKPSGFYIVGWKDGRVTKVPIGDVRWNKGEKEKVALSFPGMPNYDPSGPRLHYVEFADRSPTQEEFAAYKKVVAQLPCASCNK